MFVCFLLFGLPGKGGKAYAHKADKARGVGVGLMLTLADKGGSGGLANADIG